jgi:hypothetical protein
MAGTKPTKFSIKELTTLDNCARKQLFLAATGASFLIYVLMTKCLLFGHPCIACILRLYKNKLACFENAATAAA